MKISVLEAMKRVDVAREHGYEPHQNHIDELWAFHQESNGQHDYEAVHHVVNNYSPSKIIQQVNRAAKEADKPGTPQERARKLVGNLPKQKPNPLQGLEKARKNAARMRREKS